MVEPAVADLLAAGFCGVFFFFFGDIRLTALKGAGKQSVGGHETRENRGDSEAEQETQTI